MKPLLLFLALVTHACAFAQTIFSDDSFSFVVRMDSVNGDDGFMCNVQSIDVHDKDGNALVQRLHPEENFLACELTKRDFFFVEDMNFDGYNDVRLLQSLSPGGNEMHFYWLYDPGTKQFLRDSVFEQALVTVTFDRDKKTVASYWSGGTEFGIDTYKIVDRQLVLVEQEMTHPEESATEYYLHTVRRLVNGKMQLVKEERLNEAQFQKLLER